MLLLLPPKLTAPLKIMMPTTHVMRKDSDAPQRIVGRAQRTSGTLPAGVSSFVGLLSLTDIYATLPLSKAISREPTSGLEPPTYSLRVRGQGLLGVALACKSRISKQFLVPCIAHYCRVLRAG